MKHSWVTFALISLATAQQTCTSGNKQATNTVFHKRFPTNQLSANACSDGWFYESPSGNEYALVGCACANAGSNCNPIKLFNLTDITNVQFMQDLPMPCSSIWYDIKIYNHVAYAVCDSGYAISGYVMGKYDLTDVDNNVVVSTPIYIQNTGTPAASNRSSTQHRHQRGGCTAHDQMYVAEWTTHPYLRPHQWYTDVCCRSDTICHDADILYARWKGYSRSRECGKCAGSLT